MDNHFFALEYTHTRDNHTTRGKFSFENTQIRYVSISGNQKKDEASFVKVSFYKNMYMLDNGTIAEASVSLSLDGRKDDFIWLSYAYLTSGFSDVMTLVENNLPYVYVSLNDGMKMPITYMGDGINKVLHLLLLILTSPNGIVLLDEIENGFHYSVISEGLTSLVRSGLGHSLPIGDYDP